MMEKGKVIPTSLANKTILFPHTATAIQMQAFTEELTCAVSVLDDYGQYEDALW